MFTHEEVFSVLEEARGRTVVAGSKFFATYAGMATVKEYEDRLAGSKVEYDKYDKQLAVRKSNGEVAHSKPYMFVGELPTEVNN